ncbi:MAG: OsmC family protein [candidate division WOR-3 bacterium]
MTTKLRLDHISGMRFVAQGPSGRPIHFDVGPERGGEGPTPMETLLACAAACTGMDVVSILGKTGVGFSDFWIDIEGRRAETHPRVYEEIRIEYHFVGQEKNRGDYEKAARLSIEKYCSVSAHLKAIARLEWEVIIHPERAGAGF